MKDVDVEREQQEEFLQIRSGALGTLRKGGAIVPLVSCLAMPSFDDWTSVHIVKGDEGSLDLRAWRMVWAAKADTHAFSSPVERLRHGRPYQPSISIAEIEIAPK